MAEAIASATVTCGSKASTQPARADRHGRNPGAARSLFLTIRGFATLGNLSVILSNSTSLVILSCGMAVVIISRGLDLSQVAAMVAGATTFCTLINAGLTGPPAFVIAVVAWR